MVWIAIVIATFLFYQFVPWRQKLLVFKIGGGLAALIGLGAGAFSLYSDWKVEQQKSWKTVRFLHLKDSRDTGKKELAVEICNKRPDTELLKYQIYITGYESGRSSGMKIFTKNEWESWDGSSEFESDLIVKRNSCTTIVWTGFFRIYDRYEVKSSYFWDVWDN